jgi:hypothetical protein
VKGFGVNFAEAGFKRHVPSNGDCAWAIATMENSATAKDVQTT